MSATPDISLHPAHGPPWLAELRETVRLAWPIALTLLGIIAMEVTDVVMIGRLGEVPLAAAALGANLWSLIFLFGMGVVSVVAPLAAQAFGVRDIRRARRVVRQGLWVGVTLGVPSSLGMIYAEELFLLLGQEPEVAAGTGEYLKALGWSYTLAFWWVTLRLFMAALNVTRPAMWILFSAVPLNALLNYILIYGNFGAPRLELFGAGLATLLAEIYLALSIAIYVGRSRRFRRLHVFARIWRADWAIFRTILRIGIPAGLTTVMEAGLFAVTAVMMGWLGATALAAHHIVSQLANLTFMAPMGVSQAATVRIGQAAGRRDLDGVRRAGFVAFGAGAVFMLCMATLLAVFAPDLVGLFLRSDEPALPAILAIAVPLVYIAAAFQLVDGGQVIALGTLRGVNDTTVPMVYSFFTYWLIGLGSGYLLAFEAGWGPSGLWFGLLLGLAAAALIGFARFSLLSRRPDSAFRRVARSGS